MRRMRMHDSAFKAKVAFEAAKGEKTIVKIASIYGGYALSEVFFILEFDIYTP